MKKGWITIIAVLLLGLNSLSAQEFLYKSKVINENNEPVEGAVVNTMDGTASTVSDKDGLFELKLPKESAMLEVNSEGFYPTAFFAVTGTTPKAVVLASINRVKFTELPMLPYEPMLGGRTTPVGGVEKKDYETALTLDEAIQNQIPGLRTIQKSGMPGEGDYFNIRGIHSLVADNKPLIVLNGLPVMATDNFSIVVNGYSKSLLQSYNPLDIKRISVLKGAAAGIYGSLGSNGVIMIETEQAQSENMETRISFTGQYGLSLQNRSYPLLNAPEYADYMRNVGMTRYHEQSALFGDYPFLQGTTDYYHHYIFNNNTDWQKEIYAPAMTTNNVFRVEGGDEIAKYNLSLGYTNEGGIVKNTGSERYNTLLNANILVTRDVDIFAGVGLSYYKSTLMEQGLYRETNPVLAAYYSMPQLNPYMADDNGRLISRYAPYHFGNVNETPTYDYENVSNPLAIVNTIEGAEKTYDINIRLGLNYRINEYLKLQGVFNLLERYTEEKMFIPGKNQNAIIPQYYEIGENTVRKGIAKSDSRYFGFEAAYNRTFDYIHQLSAKIGSRTVNSSFEYDMSTGYNTANDFYKTLDKTTQEEWIDGMNSEWKWVNHFLYAGYTFKNIFNVDFNMSLDASSVSGADAQLYYAYPSVGLTYMATHWDFMPEFINQLNLRAEYATSGNSRFSSTYGMNYYHSATLFSIGTVGRSEVPNTAVRPEHQTQTNLGLDLAMFRKRINLGLDVYQSKATDLLFAKSISSVYHAENYLENTATISGQGLELSLRADIIRSRDFTWTLGGSVSSAQNKIDKLGGQDKVFMGFTEYGDDAQLLMKVGESPYQFYGYKTDGVYSSAQQAADANLTNINGGKYQAGDVRFVDQLVNGTKDGIINEADKVALGSATPDYFGNLFTNFEYKGFQLQINFSYSVGNYAYNAVRREMESMENFYNQSKAVLNRWQYDGQVTNMPRAAYGDPSGNNIFSDRWVEDASYLKLSSVVLGYHINKPFLGMFRSANVWVSGENLYTFTKYLGVDPEFAYSYDDRMLGFDYGKVNIPRSVRLGFNLNF